MGKRFYYYTGPISSADAELTTPEDQLAAKEIVRGLHNLRRGIEADATGSVSDAEVQRLDRELDRRRIAAHQALIRVLQCSEAELNEIHISVFDMMPEILVLEDGRER
jgi:hypothetical protein